MTKKDKFNTSQHDFRGQLLYTMDLYQIPPSIDIIYLDFAKAFDKVDHNILLQNVKALGTQSKTRCLNSQFPIKQNSSCTTSWRGEGGRTPVVKK